jgi:hypothetical protein
MRGLQWLATTALMAAAGSAWGYTAPVGVNFELEGCRNDGSITLPIGGKYVCPDPGAVGGNDSAYTNGNLGKGWNELDLVPHRLTAELGTQGAATTTYNVVVAADSLLNAKIGYDVVGLVELDARSNASCSLGVGPQESATNVTGGVDTVIYRVLTLTHDKGTTCYVNYVNRLAVGASKYSGSSLQAYMFTEQDFRTGKRTIPLPVKEILPQGLKKDMAATQDAAYAWNVTKEATPARVSFPNTCDATASRKADVKVRVEWSVLPGAPGKILVVTNIYARNPASRTIEVRVTDTIYGLLAGAATESIIDNQEFDWMAVPANQELKVATHTAEADVGTTNLSDLAVAEYRDQVTGIAVPGQTQATASAPVQAGNTTNTSATITDVESISGAGLKFTVNSLTMGSAAGAFEGGYSLGTGTVGPVTWVSAAQPGKTDCTVQSGCPVGYVEFNKSIEVEPRTITTGSLYDEASLLGSDGYVAGPVSASIAVTADAKVKLKIVKTIPDILQGSDTVTINFLVKDADSNIVASPSLTFLLGQTEKAVVIDGLAPGNYTVKEEPFNGLVPSGDSTVAVNIGLDDCYGEAKFDNIVGAGSAIARVKKVTDPAGSEAGWAFKLKRGGSEVSTATTTGTDFVNFLDSSTGTDLVLPEGGYIVSETLQSGWKYSADTGCVFTVDYPRDFGRSFDCVFTNVKLGRIVINKVTVPAGDTATSFRFTENVPQGTSDSGEFYLKHDGSETFVDVEPGTYAVVEDLIAGYDLTDLKCTEGSSGTLSTVSVPERKATIAVDPGETVSCTFTNTKRGKVELVKLTNGVPDATQVWSFTLKGPGGNLADSTPPALVDFGGATLTPGQVYSLCETGIPAGWTQTWYVDANGNGAIDSDELPLPLLSPFGPGNPGGTLLASYDPDPGYGTPNAVNDTRCVDFKVGAGETLKLILDNTRPGGEPRTIGYWKNWSSCTGGGQAAKATANGGWQNGWWLIDNVLPQSVGSLTIASCTPAVRILSKSTIDTGKNMAADAAYGLASQLLAAKANLYAGAETCSAAVGAVASANSLLVNIGFDGKKAFLPSSVKGGALTTRNTALSLANTLDRYNNGFLCQ